MLDLNGQSILITGGTGSFGKAFVKTILTNFPQVKKLVIFSRDELKQFQMQQEFPISKYPALRYFIGDVRDGERLKRACEGIDIVIHTAALKQVTTAEYNPMECIKTNVMGAYNIIDAAIATNVKKVVALSTDKAAAPVNLYGATKLCSDKLFIAANNMKGSRDLTFSVVRYGNVVGSRGSVMPFFLDKVKEGILPITHPDMTRFNITLAGGIEMVFFALEKALGGEIFVPKLASYKIVDVAKSIGPDCEQRITGIRPGEKLHEEMITASDSINTIELDKYYIICPANLEFQSIVQQDYIDHYQAKMVQPGFSYNSQANADWLSVEDITKLVQEQIDPNFKAKKEQLQVAA